MNVIRLGYKLQDNDDLAFNVRRASDGHVLNSQRFDTEKDAKEYAIRVIKYVEKEYNETPELEIVEEDCSKGSVKKMPKFNADFEDTISDEDFDCEFDWTEDDCLPRR